MSSISPPSPGIPSRRFYELDSLRGLAALTVVFYHFTLICSGNTQELLFFFPLRLFIAGHQAVILFFLLSGFVLTLPYAKHSSLSYGPFLLKRICRIYLPYLGALVLALVCDHFFSRHIAENPWTRQTWSEPITAKLVMQHILFLGNYDWAQFNTAFWSLVYEMRISLAFPLIALAVLRLRVGWSLLIAILLSLCFAPLARFSSATLHLSSNSAAVNSTITLHFAAFFILGSLLAKKLDQVNGWYKRLHPLATILLSLAAFLLYCGTNAEIVSRHLRIRGDYYDWGTAAGAVMIMVLAMNASLFHTFLTSKMIHHLGKISYSLYLVHGTVLFTLIHTLLGSVPMPTLLLIYLTATLAITEIFYTLIERPTMLLGRRLTAPPASRQHSPVAISIVKQEQAETYRG